MAETRQLQRMTKEDNMLTENTADVIAAMYNEDDAKVKEFAKRMEAVV